MKVIQMPPVRIANLVANSGNTAYRVDIIGNKLALAQVNACHLFSVLKQWWLSYLIHIHQLAHWGRDKMAAISADDIVKCIFLNEKV